MSSVIVVRNAFLALGFQFEFHLADFGFVSFLSTFLLFFYLLFPGLHFTFRG